MTEHASTAITPLVEMEFDDRFRGLRAAQMYLRDKGANFDITVIDGIVHAFIEAYNNDRSTDG